MFENMFEKAFNAENAYDRGLTGGAFSICRSPAICLRAGTGAYIQTYCHDITINMGCKQCS